MPTTIADAPIKVSEEIWGVDENDEPILLVRKPRPTVWGLTEDDEADPQEDDEPVDSIFALLQCDLLIDALNNSWTSPDGKPFLIVGNVGLFYERKVPPLVPDTMLSLGVPLFKDLGSARSPRSYMAWRIGKLPEVVFEFVSKTKNDEDGIKLEAYEEIGIRHYVVFDPGQYLSKEVLRVFHLVDGIYDRDETQTLPDLGLGVKLWKGSYNGQSAQWLRWCDAKGGLLPTAAESKLVEMQRADEEREKARTSAELLDQARAKLRELGVDF